MEINTKPPVLKQQEKKPNLVSFMKESVEESINRQLDRDWDKDRDTAELNNPGQAPTEVIKVSEADFYVKVGSALMRKRLEKKIKE